MSRLPALVFAMRCAWIRAQLAALQRRAGLRPHVPSAHLVPCYPGDPVTAPADHQPGRLAPWLFVIAMTAAFLAGCVAAADSGAEATAMDVHACGPHLQPAAGTQSNHNQRGTYEH